MSIWPSSSSASSRVLPWTVTSICNEGWLRSSRSSSSGSTRAAKVSAAPMRTRPRSGAVPAA